MTRDYTEEYDKATEKATTSYCWRSLRQSIWTTSRARRVPVRDLTHDHLQNIRQDLRNKKIFRRYPLLRLVWRVRLWAELLKRVVQHNPKAEQ